MFNSENATKDIPVTVVLSTGEVQHGKLIIAITSDLSRTLNGDHKYFEFENLAGDRCFFSAMAIAQITPTDIPKVKKLDAGTDSDESFDPYRVLKVSPDADFEMVKQAYYKQAKNYHPDRFTSTELPAEMARYAENMARLVNAAFQTLNSTHSTQGNTEGQINAPVRAANE